jgi:hypothetical protein
MAEPSPFAPDLPEYGIAIIDTAFAMRAVSPVSPSHRLDELTRAVG